MNTNWEKANEGEDLAAGFLLRKGFTIIERNYHFGHGELDMVARDGGMLVFVEVKNEKIGILRSRRIFHHAWKTKTIVPHCAGLYVREKNR